MLGGHVLASQALLKAEKKMYSSASFAGNLTQIPCLPKHTWLIKLILSV